LEARDRDDPLASSFGDERGEIVDWSDVCEFVEDEQHRWTWSRRWLAARGLAIGGGSDVAEDAGD
jgi:hypothetical protein